MLLSESKCPNCGAKVDIGTAAKAAVCRFCDSEFFIGNAEPSRETAEETAKEPVKENSGGIKNGETVFAKWSDGYYYPAVIAEIFDVQIRAAFLDGHVGMVTKEQVIELDEAFNVLQFQGNWQNFGIFYKGVISCRQPMIMNYNDGDVEQIQLSQLRGAKPGEKTKKLFGLF